MHDIKIRNNFIDMLDKKINMVKNNRKINFNNIYDFQNKKSYIDNADYLKNNNKYVEMLDNKIKINKQSKDIEYQPFVASIEQKLYFVDDNLSPEQLNNLTKKDFEDKKDEINLLFKNNLLTIVNPLLVENILNNDFFLKNVLNKKFLNDNWKVFTEKIKKKYASLDVKSFIDYSKGYIEKRNLEKEQKINKYEENESKLEELNEKYLNETDNNLKKTTLDEIKKLEIKINKEKEDYENEKQSNIDKLYEPKRIKREEYLTMKQKEGEENINEQFKRENDIYNDLKKYIKSNYNKFDKDLLIINIKNLYDQYLKLKRLKDYNIDNKYIQTNFKENNDFSTLKIDKEDYIDYKNYLKPIIDAIIRNKNKEAENKRALKQTKDDIKLNEKKEKERYLTPDRRRNLNFLSPEQQLTPLNKETEDKLNKIIEKNKRIEKKNIQKIEDEPNEDKKKEMEQLQRLKEEKIKKLNDTLFAFLNKKEPNPYIKSKIKKKQKKIILKINQAETTEELNDIPDDESLNSMNPQLSEKAPKKNIEIAPVYKDYKDTELFKYLNGYLSIEEAESFFQIKQQSGENKPEFFNRIINEEPNKATKYKPNVILYIKKANPTKQTLKSVFSYINFVSSDTIEKMAIKINNNPDGKKTIERKIEKQHQDVILQTKPFLNNKEEQKGKGIKKLNKQQKKNIILGEIKAGNNNPLLIKFFKKI